MYLVVCDAEAFFHLIKMKTETISLKEDLINEWLLLIFHKFELKHNDNEKMLSGDCLMKDVS